MWGGGFLAPSLKKYPLRTDVRTAPNYSKASLLKM